MLDTLFISPSLVVYCCSKRSFQLGVFNSAGLDCAIAHRKNEKNKTFNTFTIHANRMQSQKQSRRETRYSTRMYCIRGLFFRCHKENVFCAQAIFSTRLKKENRRRPKSKRYTSRDYRRTNITLISAAICMQSATSVPLVCV